MTEAPVEISVVIPCWNVEPYLARCLESVFAALPPGSEVLAVDDGSSDGTLAVLESFAAGERRLKVLPRPHRGVSAARNAALDEARGRLVFFVDPDDSVMPGYFSAMAYEGSPLKGDYRFRTNTEIRAGYLPRVFGYSFDDVRAWYSGRPLFADREMAGVWRMAFRRGLVENVRFDETIELYEDAMFVSEALLRARSMTCVAQEIYRVTSRDDGAMKSIPRDGARLCRNKLRLLAKRRALDVAEGGSLGPLYAASCVFSALEILSCTVRGRLPRREGMRILREYLADPFVRSSVREFPLSLKKPLLASAVLALRLA